MAYIFQSKLDESGKSVSGKKADNLEIIAHKILDAYFALEKIEKDYKNEEFEYTVKKGDAFNNIANKNQVTPNDLKKSNPQIKNIKKINPGDKLIISKKIEDGKKRIFRKINSTYLGMEVYIIVKTSDLLGKKIKIFIKQGKEKVLSEIDNDISILFDNKEISTIEAVIGALANDTEFKNSGEFKDFAIAKIIIGRKDIDKINDTWIDFLNKTQNRKSYQYLLVDAHSENKDIRIKYMENEGKWLNSEGKWFELIHNCCKNYMTKDEVKSISNKLKDSNINKHINGLNKTFEIFEINTCLRKIHFLAQVFHESARLSATREGGKDDNSYGGFPGRGLIQTTYKVNYKAYGDSIDEDVISSLSNKQKLEKDPHAAQSAGFYWKTKGLNQNADDNDFIYITFKVNGGFNGYNDRLKYVEAGFSKLYEKCLNRDANKKAEYKFKDSKGAYNNSKSCFAWGLWHDPDINKVGCTSDKTKALEGYERFIELTDSKFKQINWYSIQDIEEFSGLKSKDNNGKTKNEVKIRDAAEQRIKKLKTPISPVT